MDLPSQSLEQPAQDLIDGVTRFASGLAQLPRGVGNDRNFAQQALKGGGPKKDIKIAISKGATAQSLPPEKQGRYVSLIVDSAERRNAVKEKGLTSPSKTKQVSLEA